jgi:gluconokinase
MNLLCFDVSSGGITAGLLDSSLAVLRITKNPWALETDQSGAAVLPLHQVLDSFKRVIQELSISSAESIDAICLGTFMHDIVLLDDNDRPLTPLFTWLDHRGESGVPYLRQHLRDFHQRTGCRFHPMFPVFKLASMLETDAELLKKARRIVSIKAVFIHRLTGVWVEDHGMASASGLFNIANCDWDESLLDLLGISRAQLPAVSSRNGIAGRVTTGAASEFGLPSGSPVVVGSGDGFLANVGSDCEVPSKIAITLGTSAVARQTLRLPVFDSAAGTFCYRASEDAYLLGCAGSNGGNVLDWGRRIFGTDSDQEPSADPAIFIPLLHGERSPDWNPHLTGSWHGLTARHTAADLLRSILEGVIFNLAHFVEILQETSGEVATDLVISGNGFRHPVAAPALAAVTGLSVWAPKEPGLASLRGAGICALRALGAAVPPLAVASVESLNDEALIRRYREYRRLRAAV